MEEARDAEVREEDAEKARRRDERIKKWEAKRAKRKDAEERLKRELGVVGDDVRVADVHTYADEFEDSDDSALRRRRRGQGQVYRTEDYGFRLHHEARDTHVGAKATVDTMFEMRRYGNCQLSLNAKLEATAKFKSSADAMDECRLPSSSSRRGEKRRVRGRCRSRDRIRTYKILCGFLNPSREPRRRRCTNTSVNPPTIYIERSILRSSKSTASGPRPEDVSPSALVLSNDESFVSAYGERTNALLRVDWLEAYEEEDARTDDGRRSCKSPSVASSPSVWTAISCSRTSSIRANAKAKVRTVRATRARERRDRLNGLSRRSFFAGPEITRPGVDREPDNDAHRSSVRSRPGADERVECRRHRATIARRSSRDRRAPSSRRAAKNRSKRFVFATSRRRPHRGCFADESSSNHPSVIANERSCESSSTRSTPTVAARWSSTKSSQRSPSSWRGAKPPPENSSLESTSTAAVRSIFKSSRD